MCPSPLTALVLSGGVTHDFAATSACLADVLASDGWEVGVTESATDFAERLPEASLAVLNTLRWTMQHPERYAAQAATHGFRTPPTFTQALTAHLAAGRGVLALHAASLCFDDWDEWPRLLGAVWDWARSWHPSVGPMQVEISRAAHPIVADLDDFATHDEAYSDLLVADDVTPLASTVVDGDRQPLVWVRPYGGGRVAHDTLGHHAASYESATRRELLRRLARYTAFGTTEPRAT